MTKFKHNSNKKLISITITIKFDSETRAFFNIGYKQNNIPTYLENISFDLPGPNFLSFNITSYDYFYISQNSQPRIPKMSIKFTDPVFE